MCSAAKFIIKILKIFFASELLPFYYYPKRHQLWTSLQFLCECWRTTVVALKQLMRLKEEKRDKERKEKRDKERKERREK